MMDKQIRKALECCSKANDCIYCEYEPAEYEKGTIGCANELMKNALDLINGQKSKIHALEYDFELLKQEKKVVEFIAVNTFADKLKYTIDHCSISTLSKLWLINSIEAQVDELRRKLDG